MNEKLTYHFHKVIKVIQSCKNDEHVFGAKVMVANFINYWVYQKLDSKTLSSYANYLNILLKYKRNNIFDYDK